MTRSAPSRRLSVLACAVLAAFGCITAHANPTGGAVVSGAAVIGASGSNLVVNQSSSRAVVNWQSFSIKAGETTRFNLPSSSAAILNRVITSTPSAIYGNLTSNGQVFLINPNGIVVGPGGVINVGHLGLSTRDVSNAQFMAGGDLLFSGSSAAAVVNLGTITATGGDALMIAARVENAGVVDAPRGVAAFISGNEVLYAPDANSRIVVRSGVDAAGAATGVDNSGVIRAAQVELRSAGGNPYAIAVNSTGLISATRVESVGGRVLLSGDAGRTQVAGTIEARADASGGAIDVLGHDVTLASGAVLDASGSQGGGTLRIGGDFQGRNPAIQNAASTTVESGARLIADATGQGNGGQVVVWADGTTSYQGAISARGGAQGGNGGSAEVSGKTTLDFRGTADLRAPHGATGTLLLDPTDITIGVGGTSSNGGASSYLELATLEASLATANVTVNTSSGSTGSGDITIAPTMANSTVGAVNSLTLLAERDILVNGPFLVFAPTSNPLVPPTLTMIAGRDLMIAPNMNSLGMGGFAVGGEAGLTLVSAKTVPFGQLSIGANSNIGTIAELTSGASAGGPIRVFAAAPEDAVLTGWTSAASKPSVIGKAFGDAGTAATGIYYQAAFTPFQVVVVSGGVSGTTTTATASLVLLSDAQLVALQSGITPTQLGLVVVTPTSPSSSNPFVSNATQDIIDTMAAAVKARSYTSFFGPDVDALIAAAGVHLPSLDVLTPEAMSAGTYANAILAYVTSIGNKAPSARTPEEQKIYDYVSAAVFKAKTTSLKTQLAPVQAALDTATARLAALQSDLKAAEQKYTAMETGMTSLFGDGFGSIGNDGQLTSSAGLVDQMSALNQAIAVQQDVVAKATKDKSDLAQQGLANTTLNQLNGTDAAAALSQYLGQIVILRMYLGG